MISSIPCPTCRTPLSVLSPEQVVAYLERMGWTVRVNANYRPLGWLYMYRSPEDEDYFEIPMGADCRDYPRRFLELVTDLARIEQRPIPDILSDMATPSFEPTVEQIDRVGEMLSGTPSSDYLRGVSDALEIVRSLQADLQHVLPDLQKVGRRAALEEVETMLQGLLER